MSLQALLESGKFVVTAEIAPPKGTDIGELNTIAERLKGWIHAANVTDQQSSVMRLGSLVTCHLIKEKGLEPIYQLTCRDRNRIALQSDLLSASVLGLENVLALTGDLPELGDHPEAQPVYDLDSVQLLQTISSLNGGHDMAGNELAGKTNLFAGAVVNPGADTDATYELQIMKMEKKIKAGAKFFQTQAIFDAKLLADFMERVKPFNVPVIVGIVPLKSGDMGRYMNENIPGVNVPQGLIDIMDKAENKTRAGLAIAAGLIRDTKDLCNGVHIMAINWERKVPTIVEMAGL